MPKQRRLSSSAPKTEGKNDEKCDTKMDAKEMKSEAKEINNEAKETRSETKNVKETTQVVQKLTANECILLMQSKQHSFEKELDKLRIQIDSVQKDLKNMNENLLKDIKFQNECLIKKLDHIATSESIERHPLKRYRNLPILKLSVEMNTTTWFAFYEKTMGTHDEEILKACLVYYLSDSAQKNYLVDYIDLDYNQLKKEITTKKR